MPWFGCAMCIYIVECYQISLWRVLYTPSMRKVHIADGFQFYAELQHRTSQQHCYIADRFLYWFTFINYVTTDRQYFLNTIGISKNNLLIEFVQVFVIYLCGECVFVCWIVSEWMYVHCAVCMCVQSSYNLSKMLVMLQN